MTAHVKYRHQWIFSVAALAGYLTVGWAIIEGVQIPAWMRDHPLPRFWVLPFALFGFFVAAVIVLDLSRRLQLWALALQVVSVAGMVAIVPSPVFSVLLVIIAWQVAMTNLPMTALGWVAAQTLLIIVVIGQSRPGFEVCFIFGLSLALQLFFVFTAHALRLEAETARALAQSNAELRSAQLVVANAVRDAERLRISRELHDAWGHELTALGLQLEIASHILERGAAYDNVMQAKMLSKALLTKVRDIVATLRDGDSCNLNEALQALVQSIPVPAVHLDISPNVRVTPDQAHALMRCAQEALTNAVKHASASNLWLHVAEDRGGIRLIARDDGRKATVSMPYGSGLIGMQERLEHLGGELVVKNQSGSGFMLAAWLPSRPPIVA